VFTSPCGETLSARASLVIGNASTCPGDTNGDGVVNFLDLNAVLSAFGQSGDGLPGDIDGDGVVDFLDLNALLSAFGAVCD
jgi:hypothetical protein